MPLISDSTGVLRSQETKPFIGRFQKSINSRITAMEGSEALLLLHAVREQLCAEETDVIRAGTEIDELWQRLAAVSNGDELALFTTSFQQLTAAQFRKRASVSTFHRHYTRFMELLTAYATTTALAILQRDGIELPENSWCTLASGALGREEPSQRHLGQIILIADNYEVFSKESFKLFVSITLTILEPLLMPGVKRAVAGSSRFWAGSVAEWLELVAAGLHEGLAATATGKAAADKSLFTDIFGTVADLRPLNGAIPLASAVIENSRQLVAAEFSREKFRQSIRKMTTMPVAIGIFGRFKTIHRGRHRGEFLLEELALEPLITATRAFAFACGIRETATVARLKGILATGNLGVALADRLLIAYHDFMKTYLELELQVASGDEKIFCNPDSLDEVTRGRFRSGLEEVTTLQRLAYQQLVEGT